MKIGITFGVFDLFHAGHALMLKEARESEQKHGLARVYVAETMPKIRGSVAALQAIDPAPIEARVDALA